MKTRLKSSIGNWVREHSCYILVKNLLWSSIDLKFWIRVLINGLIYLAESYRQLNIHIVLWLVLPVYVVRFTVRIQRQQWKRM